MKVVCALILLVMLHFGFFGESVRLASHRGGRNSVAVVVDEACYAEVHEAVDEYCSAIETYDGKKTIVVVIPNTSAALPASSSASAEVITAAPAITSFSDSASRRLLPRLIRDTLIYLHKHEGLEGVVLVGDVPIPMIRGAHHLTTAFKMDPSRPWEQSSVPSDRFYDDFSLAFDFLRQDGDLWYYELSPQGSQKINCDIYSARIKPSKVDPEYSFHELVGLFLRRAAAAKAQSEPLDNIFHFAGQGNSSDSFNARIDENRAINEQFGAASGHVSVHFLNHDEEPGIKLRFLAALADSSLDYAHVHTHGEVNTQYLTRETHSTMALSHVDNAKRFLRDRMRNSSDKAVTRAELIKTYDVPSSWLSGWDDPAMTRSDSLLEASYDVHIEDLDGYTSGVKMLLLDACFNGAFIHDDYIAARYAFGPGSRTLVVTANSVNVVQDHWKNELAGVLARGVCAGNWSKYIQTLESHLFGDPTFHFTPSGIEQRSAGTLRAGGSKTGQKSVAGRGRTGGPGARSVKRVRTFTQRIDAAFARPRKRDLRRFAKSEIPDFKAFAIRNSYFSMSELREVFAPATIEPSLNVRTEAFMFLVRNGSDDDLRYAIEAGLNDSCEFIRRMASRYAETFADAELLPLIARHYLDPFETARVRFHLLRALSSYDCDSVKAALDAAKRLNFPSGQEYAGILARLERDARSNAEDFAAIANPSAKLKLRSSVIKAQRNACHPAAVEPMLDLLENENEDESLRLAAAEALGWHNFSSDRRFIRCRLAEILSADRTFSTCPGGESKPNDGTSDPADSPFAEPSPGSPLSREIAKSIKRLSRE